jgi:hypothetical protein
MIYEKEFMTMIIYTKKDLQELLRNELKQYETAVGQMTKEERKELRKWVTAGNRVCDNPWYLYEESGHPMYFIEAMRIAEDMSNHPENYQTSFESELCDWEEGIPF